MFCQTLIKTFLLFQIIGLIVASPYTDRQNRIVNGNTARLSDFPHQVSLRLAENSNHICGGAVLSEFWIITSAQCTQGTQSLPENIYIVVGTANLTQGGLRYDLEKIINHPNFNWNKRKNDISLLKTILPMEFSDNKVFPITLPSFKTNYTIENGIGLTQVKLSGWGNVQVEESKFELSKILRFQETSVLQRVSCRRHLGRVNGLLLNKNHLCTGVREGEGMCIGDIGSPLITENGQLVGIASWRSSKGCGLGYYIHPDVYTRVFPYENWIWSNLIDPNDILTSSS